MNMLVSSKDQRSHPASNSAHPSKQPHRSVAGLSLSFCEDPAEIRDQWLAFEKEADVTVFQSYKWTSAWCRTSAAAFGERPLIVTGHDSAGQLALILPMALVRKLSACVLRWLSQDYANYNLGLYRPDIVDQIGEVEIRAIFGQIACHWPEISAIQFRKQPFEWNGVNNPIAQLPSYPGASSAYALNLSPDFHSLYASTFSGRTRRKRKWGERNLAKLGKLKIALADTETERLELLETFLRQKAIQFQSEGMPNVFADPRVQMFYRELTRDSGDGAPFEYNYLSVGDTVAATCNGMKFQDRFYLLTISMDLGELNRWSPGFILLREKIAHHCREGTAVFDLGSGDAGYKAAWHSDEVPRFETYLSLSPRGWATTFLSETKAQSRWAIKSSPLVWKMVSSVRELIKAVRRSINSRPNSQ